MSSSKTTLKMRGSWNSYSTVEVFLMMLWCKIVMRKRIKDTPGGYRKQTKWFDFDTRWILNASCRSRLLFFDPITISQNLWHRYSLGWTKICHPPDLPLGFVREVRQWVLCPSSEILTYIVPLHLNCIILSHPDCIASYKENNKQVNLSASDGFYGPYRVPTCGFCTGM